MAKYGQATLQPEIRIRSWTGGRLASLRRLIAHLETELDALAPASVEQSAARKFDDLVPFILDLTIAAGYRQFTADFSTPPGLASDHPNRQLLFYEIQHDTSIAFSNPTIVETPERHIIIAGVGIGETRYFRARVINTRTHASRWSSTVTSTTAQGLFEQTDIDDISTRLIEDVGAWQTLFTESYDPFNGAVMLNVQLAVGGVPENVTVSRDAGGVVKTFNSGPGFVQFRFLWDDKEFGQRTILSTRPGYTGRTVGKTPLAFGTFISEFIRPGNDALTFKLQAAKLPGTEWRGGGKTDAAMHTADPLVFMKNAKIIELLETL